MKHSISLVIPVLNEEAGLKKIFTHLPKDIYEVIIVDGGSTDQTVDISNHYKSRVIRQKSKGYGGAYFEGFAAAKGDIIATLDGDGTYPIESIPRMVEWLIDKELDFISGSRFPLSDVMSMAQLNFIGNLVVTTLTSWLFNTKVIDINSGMWVFRKSFLRKTQFISSAWNLSLEIKIEALANRKIKFLEYPINYYERLGESKVVRPWKTGLKSLFFLVAKKIQVNRRLKSGQL